MKLGPIATKDPPPETAELRRALREFLDQPLERFHPDAPLTARGRSISVGAVKWGAYAFFDYDEEPIYVGQTRESLGQRIGRHLTNQRTDAVAMSVLDPFEVRYVKLWPLPKFQNVRGGANASPEAMSAVYELNAVERAVFLQCIAESSFGAVLNEKDPPDVQPAILTAPIIGEIVGAHSIAARQHPDTRIARRAATIARLAQIIASREVAGGLRRALLTQAVRLNQLAKDRYDALGAEQLVEVRSTSDSDE